METATIRVSSTQDIRGGLDRLASSHVVGVEPFSRMPLSRFGLLDALSVIHSDFSVIVTFDVCAMICEIAKIPNSAEHPADPSVVLDALKGPARSAVLSDKGFGEFLSFLQDKRVTKVVYDGRGLGDALLRQFDVRLSLVVDVRLLPMYCNFQEVNPSRRHRGVVRLPNFAALVPFCDAFPPTNLHALVMLYNKVAQLLAGGAHTISETAVASGRYLDSVRLAETLSQEAFHPYLPLGVVSSPKDGWVECSNCHRPAPPHFIAPQNGMCNVCGEWRQPCINFRRGYCTNPSCEYVHERLQCPRGASCVDNQLGFCGFLHDSDGVFLSTPPAGGSDAGPSPSLRARSPYQRNPRVTTVELQKLASSQYAKSPSPVRAAKENGAVETNGFSVTGATAAEGRARSASPAGGALDGKKNAREWSAPSATQPFLHPRTVPPCHFHFSPTGCAYGHACRFSHAPVALYVPVPVVHKDGAPIGRHGVLPCPNQLQGRPCRDRGCDYLHLPPDVPLPRKYADPICPVASPAPAAAAGTTRTSRPKSASGATRGGRGRSSSGAARGGSSSAAPAHARAARAATSNGGTKAKAKPNSSSMPRSMNQKGATA